jgi:hypothetical protein
MFGPASVIRTEKFYRNIMPIQEPRLAQAKILILFFSLQRGHT